VPPRTGAPPHGQLHTKVAAGRWRTNWAGPWPDRRHLAAALRELGDSAITNAVAIVEGTFEDHVTARDPGLRVIHEHSETVHGSAALGTRPDRP